MAQMFLTENQNSFVSFRFFLLHELDLLQFLKNALNWESVYVCPVQL